MKYQSYTVATVTPSSYSRCRITNSQAEVIGQALMVVLVVMGYFHSSPHLYLESGCFVFLTLSGALLLLSGLWEASVHILGSQIQAKAETQPNYKAEIYATLKCVFVVSWIGAWPLAKYRAGKAIGLKWNLAQLDEGYISIGFKTLCSVLFADFFSYWKHRLLHIPQLYVFHKQHHAFTNPSTFASFALHPVQAMITFAPIWTCSVPSLAVWGPGYIGHVTAFALLNLYLHCGYSVPFLEYVLGSLWLNTSRWHNIHHEKINKHFGEVSFFWDWLCGTGPDLKIKSHPIIASKFNLKST